MRLLANATRSATLLHAVLVTMLLISSGPRAARGEASPFGGHVHALAVKPDTGELLLGARPLYRSTDEGRTWEPIRGIPKQQARANITAVVVEPRDPQTVYASGHGIGVVKSTDGGRTWSARTSGLGGLSTAALALDARDPARLYVWVLGDGLYRSDDAAESWQRVDDGPKRQEIRSLASVDSPTGMGGIWLYAGVDVGVMKSPDCFCGWDRLASAGLPQNRRVYSLAADPHDAATLYAGLRDGVYKTTDGGASWRRISDATSDAIVAPNPREPGVVYAASSDGRLHRTTDGGRSWQRMH